MFYFNLKKEALVLRSAMTLDASTEQGMAAMVDEFYFSRKDLKPEELDQSRHGAEQYVGDLECVFYGYHLDRVILKIAEAAYCLMPSLHTPRLFRNGMIGPSSP